jgi:16S rRNA (adenine1518-N6/adenine1519-N6)-dimethyltransferase
MDHPLTSIPLDLQDILRRYQLHPDKRLGQNFLVDPTTLLKVVDTAAIASDDTVLEIGAGLGSLTRYLAQRARLVVAIEVDERLIPALKEVVASYSNVQIIQGDILELNPNNLISSPAYLVVANIPYYITSALIRHLLEVKNHPRRMVLTVQREVARRICANPGDMSLLALSVQVYGKPHIAELIPAGAFYPVPKVDSAVVRVDLYPEPVIPPTLLSIFFHLAKAGFSQKRKMLRNALAGGLHWPADRAERLLRASGIDPKRRAETLNLVEWGILAESYQAFAGGPEREGPVSQKRSSPPPPEQETSHQP